MAPTVVIIGGTGKTGKWAVKGAVVRGYTVRVLGRSPDKVAAVLRELFPDRPQEQLLSEVAVVQGDVNNQETLAELFRGADVVLSFLGMVKPPQWVVRPGVESIIETLKTMQRPPRFISMSSISVGDSLAQGRRAWGRCVTCLVWKVFLTACFKDMQAAEEYIVEAKDSLDVTVMRATILGDKSGYLKDYSQAGNRSYRLVKADETAARLTFTVDRQDVAEAFLDACDRSLSYGPFISVFGI